MAAHIAGSATSYATIQAAVDAAVAGARITVDAGTYKETVSIYKSITLVGAQAGVDGRGTRGAESIIWGDPSAVIIGANNVTLDGFTIQGNKTNVGARLAAGVFMKPSINGTHVVNNIIKNNVTGLYLSNNSDTNAAVIQRNYFYDNTETGADWTYGWNGSRAIYTDGEVSGGLLTNAWIDSNKFYRDDSYAGEGLIALSAQTANKQFNITISNNSFDAVNGYSSKAVLVFNTTNLTVIGNTITNQNDGSSGPLRFEGNAHNVNITYNSIFNNPGPGIAVDSSGVEGSSSDFFITKNNIYGNTLGLLTIASAYDGTVTAPNNWWGSASGPSGVGPGTGQQVWSNGTSGHYLTPKGAPGGSLIYSPWATALINIAAIPAPAAPTALAVAAVSSAMVKLSWTAPYSTAINQLIQRSTDGVNFVTVATVPPLLNSFTDSGLSASTTYSYRVLAANGTGTSAASNVASSKPLVYQPPVAPAGLKSTSTSGNSISLAWSAPSYAAGIANYVVYRNGVAVGSPTGLTFTDTGLNPSTTYTYAVATLDTAGATSAKSASITAATTAMPIWSSVSLSSNFNRIGFVADGTRFTTGFDGGSYALSSTLLGSSRTWNGSTYVLGTAGTNNVVKTAGQTIALAQPSGVTLGFLAAATNGNQANQTFIIRYTDGSTQSVTQSISDWASPQNYAGESKVATMAYRNTAAGGRQSLAVNVYGYSVALDSLKTVSGITLPNNANVDILAMNLYGLAPSVPAAPLNLAAAPLSGTQLKLTWTAAAGTVTAYVLQRSSDGVNFATINSSIAGTATSYTDSGLTAGATYYYRLSATNAQGTSAASAVASATTLSTSLVTTPLSSLSWTSATSGYLTVQRNTSIVGNAIKLRGTTYASGLGTHAASTVVYNLAGNYTRFLTDVGVDDEVVGKGTGSVQFQVLGDGKVLFDSGVVTNLSAVVNVSVDVSGVQNLTLIAASVGGDIDFAHADWAGARLLSNPQPPAAPTGVSLAVVSSNSIAISWNAVSAATGYAIDRSLDGNTWTALTTVAGSVLNYTDNGLTAGTRYSYRVRAINASGTSANSATASATTLANTPITTQLSSLNWTSATAGYGSVQKNLNASGDPLNIGGTPYASGIGTHADSTIVYNLAGAYTTFQTDIGFDNRTAGKPSDAVYFRVIGDGRVLYDSGSMTNASGVRSVSVDVSGVQTLSLIANAVVPGQIDYDHVDWADARLLSPGAAAAAKLSVQMASALSATATTATSSSTTTKSTKPTTTSPLEITATPTTSTKKH